ncbi:hypothetical protein FIBSPDRAFT_769763, partial [Athelia psychrophila]
YAQYDHLSTATPISSATPVVTIGGEDGGRAPVVVDDNIVPVGEAESTTSVGFGIAEPGKDIFAGEPARDIKSNAGTPKLVPAEPLDEKVVSSTVVVSSSKNAETSVEEAKLVIQTASVPDSTTEPALVKGPAGPLDEVAAEADRVAKDLYPEAHGEN